MNGWDKSKTTQASMKDDRALLRRALEHDLPLNVREAFLSMREDLETREQLSTKQRTWVQDELEKHEPTYTNAVSAGLILRGNEVVLPAVLRNLPKRPPGRAW